MATNSNFVVKNGLIVANGSVGIGISSPGFQLTVGSGSGSQVAALNGGVGTAQGAAFYFQQNSIAKGVLGNEAVILGVGTSSRVMVNAYVDPLVLRTAAAQPITFETSGTNERARIDSAGNVGIGTSSPTAKLDVRGDVNVANSTNARPLVYITKTDSGTASESGGQLQFSNLQASNLGRNVNVSAGKILWNFSQPTSGGSQEAASINVLSDAQSGPSTASSLIFSTTNVSNTAATERMRIDSSGNVGIGIIPFAYSRLSIVGNNNSIALGNASNGGFLDVSANSGVGYIWANHYYDGTTDRASSANYSPSIELHLDDGSIRFKKTTSVAAAAALVQTESMRIDSSGNVGINCIPQAWNSNYRALEINGVAALWSANNAVILSDNTYYNNSSNWVRTATANTSAYSQSLGVHYWYSDASGAAGAAYTPTTRMVLDTAGNLNLGNGTSSNISMGVYSSQSGRAAVNVGANNSGFIYLFNNFSGATDSFGMANGTTGLVTYPTSPQPIVFGTSGLERLRVATNGYIGVGNATPLSLLTVGNLASGTAEATNKGLIQIQSSGNGSPIGGGGLEFKGSASSNGFGWSINAPDLGNSLVPLCISGRQSNAAWTEIMRLDALNYYACFGTTAASGINPVNGVSMGGINGSTQVGIGHPTGTTVGTTYLNFNYNGSGIGSITQNGTTGVLFNTTSDYRLKDITGDVTDSGAFVDALKPRVGTWKSDGSPFVGFVAHEFQEVSPSSVNGEKDAEDDEGKPIMQSMQASSPEVIANMIAELQSLRARNAQLESQMAQVLAKLGMTA